jgi:hypothetical protein
MKLNGLTPGGAAIIVRRDKFTVTMVAAATARCPNGGSRACWQTLAALTKQGFKRADLCHRSTGAAMQLGKYVKFREERFGGVLFETRTEKVYTLNPTAAAVIKELGPGCDAAELTRRLADRFQAPAGSIEQDVAALIDELREKGLVEDTAA